MFRNNIRELRSRKGISQSCLSRMIGVAEPSLSQVERGQRQPWPRIKREIARVLNVTQKELFPED